VLTVLVALGGSVVAADGVSNDRERDQRERLLLFSSPLFSFFLFCCVFLSFLFLFVRLSSFCFYFLSLSIISSLSLSFFSVLSFILSSTQIFPSLFISPVFFPCLFLFFKTISLLCFFVSFLPYNLLKIFSPVTFFSKPHPSFPFSLLAFIGKRRERGLLPLSSHGIYREKEEDPLSGDVL
jgi:hypothetical protein